MNVYVNEPRATQAVDLISPRAAELAEELREHLSRIFHIAVRLRQVRNGVGYRVFQLQKTGNRPSPTSDRCVHSLKLRSSTACRSCRHRI